MKPNRIAAFKFHCVCSVPIILYGVGEVIFMIEKLGAATCRFNTILITQETVE